MASFKRTDEDDEAGAVIVRVLRNDDGTHEAMILPLSDEDDEATREGSYIVLSAYGETFPVPDALSHAQGIAASQPSISRVLVQLHEDALWDEQWGDLI